MPELLASYETELGTDFAMLMAHQVNAIDECLDMGTGTYAVSSPGGVSLTCGNKYASVHVRLERWDGPPPVPDDRWEDCDELPWQSITDAGQIVVQGFDPPEDDEGLPVEGLERGRVQVLARGRHRYTYGGDSDGLPPEEWLLRLWPDGERRDALAGPPRRLAGVLDTSRRFEGWPASVRTWYRRGWTPYLNSFPGFSEIIRAILVTRRPFEQDDLLGHFGPWGGPREESGPYTWKSNLLGPHAKWPLSEEMELKLVTLREESGLQALETFRDAFSCMERLGLLGRVTFGSSERFIANPAPLPVWEALRLPPASERGIRILGLAYDHRIFQSDIEHMVRWAPGGGLSVTPRQLGIRLAIAPEDVIETLRLLDLEKDVTMDIGSEELVPDGVVAVTAR